MNKLFYREVNSQKLIIATVSIVLGLVLLLANLPIISVFSLPLASYIAFVSTFGKKETKYLFSKPVNPIKNTIKYFIINWVVSIGIALILKYLFGWNLSSNPINNEVTPWLFLILPMSLLGEELFSIYYLSVFSSTFKLPIASLLSALIFGAAHYYAYNNGNIVQTLAHIILIQGTARIFLNQAAIKSNSIWTSWIIHVLFDFSAIPLPLLLSH